MYLSRVFLDLSKPDTAMAMVRPSRFHGAVERAFEGERQHALWRVDRTETSAMLLIVSNSKPELSSLQTQFGSYQSPAVIDYEPYLEHIARGGRYQFRLTANPVVCINGKRVPLVVNGTAKYGDVCEWARSRLERNGCLVEGITVAEHRNVAFTRENGHRVQFLQVVFDGVCEVSDADAARQAMRQGIGHEKAYGCGMLTLMRV